MRFSFQLEKVSPLFGDLRSYRADWLPRDLVAGLSVAAVQVPTAVAYAQLGGFSPEVGLYASILPVIVFSFFSSSRQLVVGPDAATCAMVASLVSPLAHGDQAKYLALSCGLSMIAGLLMVLGGFRGMGFIVNFFSRPILIGFLNGVAVSIIVGQFAKVLGIALKSSDFIPSVIELVKRCGETHLMTLAVGAGTMVMIVMTKRLVPNAPYSLIALTAATAVTVNLLGVDSGVKLVGHVPGGLPTFAIPQMGYHAGQGLFVSALGLVIVSFTSGMLTARSFAARAGQSIDANREMWALGTANLASGLSGGFAITGADSRTAVNVGNKNQTQLSSVISAIATACVVLFLAAPLGLLPLSALAAVLIYSAVHLIDVSSYKELQRIDPFEFRLSMITTGGVLLVGVLPGVAVAIAMALLVILIRIYKPADVTLGTVPGMDGYNDVGLSTESTTEPNVVVWRFEGPLVFFNCDYFKTRVRQVVEESQNKPKWFVMSLEAISQMDATGVKTLEELHSELEGNGITLLFARPKTYMLKFKGDAIGLGRRLNENSVFATIGAAVEFTHGKS